MSILNLNATTLTRLICFVIAVLLITIPVTAQDAGAEATDLLDTIETEEEEGAAPRWLTSIAFGGSLTSGNSDTLGLNLAIGSEKKTDDHEFALGLTGSYGETDGDVSTETGSLFFNYKKMFGSSYIFSDNELFHDKIALIEYRFTAAIGYGHYVIDNDQTKLGLEAGVAYIRESYENPPDEEVIEELDADDRFTLRVAQTFEHKLSEKAKIWQSLEYLPEFNDFDNFLLNATAGVEAALNSTLSLRFSVGNRYNANPPYDTKKNDLVSVVAVAIRL